MNYKGLFLVAFALLLAMPFAHADTLEYDKQWLEQEKNFLSSKI